MLKKLEKKMPPFTTSHELAPKQHFFLNFIDAFSNYSLSHFSNNSPLLAACSVTLNPMPAADPLTIKFVLDVWRDAQLSTVLEANPLFGEEFW